MDKRKPTPSSSPPSTSSGQALQKGEETADVPPSNSPWSGGEKNNARPTSYLDNLEYDPELNKGWLPKYLLNPRLVMLVLFSIVAAGMVSYFNLPRALNPEVEIPLVVVSTTLPGASPSEIEDLVSVPIEDAVNSLDGIDEITSSSRDSVSTVVIQFESTVNADKAKQDVQSAVDTVRDLPDDASDPFVQKLDFEDQPIWQFAVYSTSDQASLNRFVTQLDDELTAMSAVDRVVISGQDEQEIQMLIKQEAIREFGINPLALSQAIQTSLSSFPAGSVQTKENTFAMAIDPQVTDIDELRQLQVSISGKTYALSDVAEISYQTTPGLWPAYYATAEHAPSRSVQVSVYKTSSVNITDAIVVIEDKVDEIQSGYNGTFEIVDILNLGQQITDQFDELTKNFLSTVVLVFLTLFVFLGIRQALITSLTIPLSFFTTFVIMQMTGISLNFLSMFSLIIALGLLVDDAIVIVAAMTRYYRRGRFTAAETGLLVWRDFIVPIWTTTLTTVWAFVPLLLATGIIGEFIKSVPIVVSAALLSSTTIAVFITLPLMIVILEPNVPERVKWLIRIVATLLLLGLISFALPVKAFVLPVILVLVGLVGVVMWVRAPLKARLVTPIQTRLPEEVIVDVDRAKQVVDHGFINAQKLNWWYKDVITSVLRKKRNRRMVVGMVVVFALFSYMLLPLGLVQNEFFPRSDADVFYAQLELPSGTDLDRTEGLTLALLDQFRMTEGVSSVTATIGQTVPDAGPTSNGPNLALFTFRLPPEDEQTIGSIELANELRDQYKNYNQGELNIIELSSGPPAGADIQVVITGADLEELDLLAGELIGELKTIGGITSTSKSIQPGTSKIQFVPDQRRMLAKGLDPAQVGIWLRTYLSGSVVDEVQFDSGEKHDLVIRTSDGDLSAETIGQLTLNTAQGEILLSDIGDFRLVPNPTVINRVDGDRSVTVTAGVDAAYSITEINAEVEDYLTNVLELPQGYAWSTGGVNEENQSSVNSIIQAMGVAAILILVTMVVQLGSFRKAIIVLLVIPLAISGVFIIFALTGTPLSFPALIGLLALFGIVVNNSIVVVDKINQNLKIGMEFVNAIADAAAGRLEAILFSSMTTAIGLLPITLSDPIWRGTGGAIIAGLLFSGTIMLFFIPVVYYMWFWRESREA